MADDRNTIFNKRLDLFGNANSAFKFDDMSFRFFEEADSGLEGLLG